MDGRAVVVGLHRWVDTRGEVNRLLLRNTRRWLGRAGGAYVMGKPAINREIGAAIERMIAAGAVRPIVGARFPLTRGADAMRLIEERRATGKVVLEVPGEQGS